MSKILICVVTVASCAFAQTTGTASIVGAATDSTGSVIAGAKVTVVNTSTQFVANTVTTAEGTYYVPYLNPGNYQITIEAAGFKKYVRKGFGLDLNQVLTVDITLQVGGSTETVEVTGAPPVVDTTSTQLGAVVNEVDRGDSADLYPVVLDLHAGLDPVGGLLEDAGECVPLAKRAVRGPHGHDRHPNKGNDDRNGGQAPLNGRHLRAYGG